MSCGATAWHYQNNLLNKCFFNFCTNPFLLFLVHNVCSVENTDNHKIAWNQFGKGGIVLYRKSLALQATVFLIAFQLKE